MERETENNNQLFGEVLKTARTYAVPIIRTKSHELLEEITLSNNPAHILEIGTAIGYSGISMLGCCKGDLITIEHNEEYILQAKKNFELAGLKERVKIIRGDCHIEIAKMLYSGKFDEYFDMIFLDGPKAQYIYLLDGLIELLRPGGVFVADNVLFRGYVQGTNVAPTKRYKTIIKRLAEFTDRCLSHEKLKDVKIYDSEDGMLFATKVKV